MWKKGAPTTLPNVNTERRLARYQSAITDKE